MNSTINFEKAIQRKAAKVAGFMFLFVMPIAMFGQFYVRFGLYVPNNPSATAENIIASQGLFRIGIASELIAIICIMVLIMALYVLLKPVNKILALLATFWRLGEVFVFSSILVNSFVVLLLLGESDYLNAYVQDQLYTLMMLFFKSHSFGYIIAIILFSMGSTIFAYLLYKSNYIPKTLSGFGVFSSLILLVFMFFIILLPDNATIFLPAFFVPLFIYELVLGLWLLFKEPKLDKTAASNGNRCTNP